MEMKNKTLEELAKEIGEKIADQFMKSILARLTSEIIGLRQDTNELKASTDKVWNAIDKLAEAQKRTEERLNELAEAQKRTEERLNELAEAQKRTEERLNELAEAQKRTEERLNELAEAQKRTETALASLSEEFETFSRWARKIFGVWSHTIGFGAEAIVRDVFRSIVEMGGYKFGDVYIPPLRDLGPRKVKKDGYQFDLVGVYEDVTWIVEVKTRFLFTEEDVDDMLKGLINWRKKNPDKRFVYMLLALAGYKKGLEKYISKRIEDLRGKPIIFDDEETRRLFKEFGYEI
ncbi:MAG: hypothetical protein ACP6IP_07070 [Candidatus Njordarchaeia archaeon]